MAKKMYNDICEKSRFEIFFKAHSKNLYHFLYYKFGNQLQIEDKVQEAFIKLWQNCKKVSPEKAKSYVYTVANNTILNELAHQKVVLNFKKNKPRNYTNESPEFLLEEKEYLQKLERALSKLTEAERVAFMMNRTEGKRFKEIATILGISTKAVEKRIYGALKKLRKDLDEL